MYGREYLEWHEQERLKRFDEARAAVLGLVDDNDTITIYGSGVYLTIPAAEHEAREREPWTNSIAPKPVGRNVGLGCGNRYLPGYK
jgi:hypothetical protein